MKYNMLIAACLVSVGCGVLSGCSSEPLVAPIEQNKDVFSSSDVALSALQQASVCCNSFSDFPYSDVKIGKVYSPISKTSPVFNFKEGNSYFAAYRLPEHTGDIRITVASQVDKTVFYPRVIMLDSQFRVTRVIGDDIFTYKPAELLQLDRIESVFTVDRSRTNNPNNETYMILYSPADQLNKTTTILHPAKAFARAHSTVEPNVKDPVINHSAWGLVELDFDDLSVYAGKDNVYMPEYAEEIKRANNGVYVDVNKKPVVAPNKLVVEPAAAVAAVESSVVSSQSQTTSVANSGNVQAGGMLPETEQLYNQFIEKAVSAGNIEKAMQLANEAERAGSKSAKTTLVNAIKNSQK